MKYYFFPEDIAVIEQSINGLDERIKELAKEQGEARSQSTENMGHDDACQVLSRVALKKYGGTDFITASLAELLLEKKKPPTDHRPIIFSPFGLGILDIQLARFLYKQAAS